MAYSQFSFQKIRDELGIEDIQTRLFSEISQIEPSAWLIETLTEEEELAYFSEKSRSEAVVFPILVEMWKRNKKQFSIYSGPDLDGDSSKGLSGECDFILSKGQQKVELDSPLFCMVEAKDQDLKKAIPQCIAQMEGARLYNEKHKKNISVIWGCVTTGEIWQFLKLENQTAYVDIKRYQLVELPVILGILQTIIDFYKI